MTLDDFLHAIVAHPHSAATTWAVLADWLEEQGDPRWELARLLHQRDYQSGMQPEERDERVRQLLASGVEPIAPAVINSIGMRLVLIPAGTFLMGSPEGEGDDDEHPQHEVEFTRPFYLGAWQVTQDQYQHIMGQNPSYFCSAGDGKDKVKGRDTKQFPVETVSWDDAMTFCKTLSKLPEEKKIARSYRLPTEAEWEYACRGGAASYSPYHFGAAFSPHQANFDQTNLGRPCSLGFYPANAFGLFDMHGNVWEWCLDWYDEDYYKNSPKRDPHGPDQGNARVLRGGSWSSGAWLARSAIRTRDAPAGRDCGYGFRIAFCSD